VEASDAYYGIGTGFIGRLQYEDAIRYLDIAQARLASIGSAAKYCGALRGLHECYTRLNKPNIARVFMEKVEAEEGELRYKLNKIGKAYEHLSERLTQGSADIEVGV